jgi:hypothetical protein
MFELRQQYGLQLKKFLKTNKEVAEFKQPLFYSGSALMTQSSQLITTLQ